MTESNRRTDAPLAHALAMASETLADAPAGLLTDFDGTLSPMVDDPARAGPVDGAARALAVLIERLAVVAVVTGRAPLDARRMIGVPGLLIAGNHGTEWLEPDADAPVAAPGAASLGDRLGRLLDAMPAMPGVMVEHKGLSATIHYRTAADPMAALPRILAAIGDTTAHGIELRPGRMSVELRPIGLGDKGSAARAIVERFGLRGVVVMGDDVTDLDMFGVVAELRSAGLLRGTIIGVGSADAELPRAVLEAADLVLADPAQAAALLLALGGR